MATGNLPGQSTHSPSGDRLNSWKEIAAYLKCSERTARRWEGESLPVHRLLHKSRAGVYAYRGELDAWWNDGHARVAEMERAQAQHPRRLAQWIALTGIVGVVLVGGYLVRARLTRGNPSVPIHSVAVLPLQNLSHDPQQEYFADGITDALITDLAKIHALRVISRNSTMQYKSNPKPVPEIAQELNVDALIEGTVLRSSDRVRIAVQLVEARNGRHLWAETFEGNLRDILSLQDEVAREIAGGVRLTLTSQELNSLSSARSVDPAVHQAYLRGIYELHGMTAEPTEALKSKSLERAVGYFKQALADDPNNALAYSGLADAYYDLSTDYRAPLQVMPLAKAAAIKAIELDDTLAEAHASLAYVDFSFDWDWSRAESKFRKALELDPSLPRAHAGYAEYLMFVGHRTDEGLQELHRAYALDPLLPASHGDLAWFLFLTRRYKESIEAARSVGNDDHVMALSYAELGQSRQALAAADRAVKSTQGPVILSQIAAAYAFAGRKDRARTLLHGIEGQARERYVCGFNMASAYALLGDKGQAFVWLERAYRDRSD